MTVARDVPPIPARKPEVKNMATIPNLSFTGGSAGPSGPVGTVGNIGNVSFAAPMFKSNSNVVWWLVGGAAVAWFIWGRKK